MAASDLSRLASSISNSLSGTGILNPGHIDVRGDININSYVTPDRDDKALTALRPTDQRDDKNRIEREKGGLISDCYKWILSNEDYLKWRAGNENRLLWIRGDAGKGKTMLVCGIIDELEQVSDAAGRCVVYFFCQATDSRLNNAVGVLRGLLYGLLSQKRALMPCLMDKYVHAGQSLFQDVNAWDSLSKIFIRALNDSSLPRDTFLIVDALDECSTDLDKLLDLFKQVTSLGKVKILVSSRNWPEVAEGLSAIPESIPLRLELNQDSISNAVASYIDVKVSQLSKQKEYDLYDSELRGVVRRHFVENANATFLWVALVYQELADPRLRNWNVDRKLQFLPSGLSPFYARMITHITASPDRDFCKQVLEVVSIVFRPVTLAELARLVETPKTLRNKEKFLTTIIELCRSLIVLRQDGSVSFIHQSAKDFLKANQSARGYPSMTPDKHGAIVSMSLEVMNHTLKRNIYRLDHPGALAAPFKGPNDPLTACRYSCVFWIDHLVECIPAQATTDQNSRLLEDGGPVHDFFRKHFLHWLESIVLLKSMALGIRSLLRLEQVAVHFQETSRFFNAATLIRNATRLARYHRAGVEIAPLQVYMSGLAFSPVIARRELFQHEAPQPETAWISQTPAIEKHWSPCVMVIPASGYESDDDGRTGHVHLGHSVLSPDGTRLASFLQQSDVSDRYFIQIRDIATGHRQRTITLHAFAQFITFSPDGSLLATFWDYDSTIGIWNATTGSCEGILAANEGGTYAVAFCKGGRRLVSVSSEYGVKHWNLKTAECEQTLRAPASGPPTSHYTSCKGALFGNGERFASTDQGRISIWNSLTGERELTLDGYYAPSAITVSADGAWLAAAVDDDAPRIYVWNMAAPRHRRVLRSQGDRVNWLSFNQTGTRLVSGSLEGILRIWNVANGACEQTLAYGESIRSVAFHGTLVASSSRHVVKLWDTSSQWNNPTRHDYGDHSRVEAFTLTADRQWAASMRSDTVSGDSVLQLWQIGTGRCRRTINAGSVWGATRHAMILLSDRKLFAMFDTILTNKTRGLKIYDLITGRSKIESTVSYDESIPRCLRVSFSSCGTLIAQAKGTKSGLVLTVWLTRTGQVVHESRQEMGWDDLIYRTGFGLVCSPASRGGVDWAVLIGDETISGKLELVTPTTRKELDHGCNVREAAFSSDWLRIATVAEDDTVKLWDTATGRCMGSVALRSDHHVHGSISFTGSCLKLRTSWGLIDLGELVKSYENGYSNDSISPAHAQGYGISFDRQWLLRDSKRFLWLPPDYRPGDPSCFEVQRSTIGIATGSGRVFFLRLPEEALEI